MSRQLKVERHPVEGHKIVRATKGGQGGEGFVCSVPDEFARSHKALFKTLASDYGMTPEEFQRRMDQIIANAPEMRTRRYWPRPGEEVDSRHVATRLATHVSNRTARETLSA